jgi:small subunit ribosomal protein S13
MIFIFKKKYNTNLKVYRVLKSIYGLGNLKIKNFLIRLGITVKASLYNLKRFRVLRLNSKLNLIKKDISVTLKNKELTVHLIRVIIGSYKGIRLNLGLPLNGQRTKSNAMTTKRISKTRQGLQYFVKLKLTNLAKKKKNE